MAWKFNETDQWVTMADAAPLTLTVPWTIAGWIKLDDNIGAAYQYFCSWNSFSAPNSFNWYFAETSSVESDDLIVLVEGSNTVFLNPVSDDTAGDDTTWMHVVIRVTLSGPTAKLYKNGSEIATYTDNSFLSVNHTGQWFFGRRSDTSIDRWFGGEMAEFAKWDRALSDDEIAVLAAGYAPSFLPIGLAWYVPMVRDYTEIVGGLTVVNQGSTIAAHPPIYRPAEPYVSVGTATAPPVGNPWYYYAQQGAA